MSTHSAGHTALITGANSGIGLELTRRLLAEGWDVVALIRSTFPADEPQIAQALAQGRLRSYSADLSDFASLQSALAELAARESRLDLLFNNAAAAVGGLRQSPQGRDIHFDVNTVAPYLILMELRPLLARGSLKTVINTSSSVLLFVRQFSLERLQHPPVYKPLSGPYGASKLGLSLWTQALAPALQAEGITIRSVNPGATKTKMTIGPGMPKWILPLRNLFFAEPAVGAARLYDAAFGPWQGQSGIFINGGKARRLPFAEQAPRILEAVHAIYTQTLLKQQLV